MAGNKCSLEKVIKKTLDAVKNNSTIKSEVEFDLLVSDFSETEELMIVSESNGNDRNASRIRIKMFT